MSDPARPRRSLSLGVRSSFLTGLVVVAPVLLTGWLIWTVTGWIDSWVLPLIPERWRPDAVVGMDLRGVGLVIFLLFTVVTGWIAKGLIGRSLIRLAESIVDRMPVIRTVYNGAKQIAETIFAQTDTKFDKACLVQYPRPGIWAIGFISTRAKGEVAAALADHGSILSVFLPTTPNPTSGFLLYVPAQDVIMLDMKVEDAAKLIISAGLVYPAAKDPSLPPPGQG
jgi:uncharacterized membrane protein